MLNLENQRSEVVLLPLTNTSVLELMFLPEHDNFFRINSDESRKKKDDYIDFLLKASENRLACEIHYKNRLAGFIMVAGRDNRMVGGLYPEFKRKGIYGKARNAVIRLLNSQGIFNIVYSVDESNAVMKAFAQQQASTKLEGKLSVVHYQPSKPFAYVSPKVKLGNKFMGYDGDFYHLSLDTNLKQLTPKVNRAPLYPSPELNFRAIYPNIAHLFDGQSSLTFTVYKVKKYNKRKLQTPNELISKKLVRDAHITLEYGTSDTVELEKVGKVVIENTSNDEGLFYNPYLEEDTRYHSPKVIRIID